MAHKKMNTILGTLLSSMVFSLVAPAIAVPGAGFLGMEAGLCKVQAAEEIDGHAFLTENDSYRLYLKEDDLSLIVEDKATGNRMESYAAYDDGNNNETWIGAMNSAVVITMINGNDDTKQADLINDNVKKTITKTADGFTAQLYWVKYQFGITLEVSLTEEGLVAHVADESIVEDGNQYFIGTLSLYPYMGCSYMTDKEGYILVPDGNGALIYLTDKEGRFKSGFSSMIYGNDVGFDESTTNTLLMDRYNTIEDSEMIIAPVYGIAHTDDQMAYLAVVEDGAERATIDCVPNGVSIDYNRAYAKYILRKTYTQPTSNNSTAGSLHVYESERSHSDLQLRFLFLGGEKASYAGMANAYREYLMAGGQLASSDCSYRTRVDFLGLEQESWVLGTKDVVMTTTEDIREIYKDLGDLGVTDLFSVYKGWQKGGLNHLPISKFKADSAIGGNKEVAALVKEMEGSNTPFYLYNNALIINPDEENATFNVVKKVNKRRYEEKTYADVYEMLLYLTPDRSKELLDRFAKSYTDKGINSIALAGVTNTMFTYTYSGEKYTRFDTANTYRQAVDSLDEKADLVMEQPFAYLWKNTDSFLDMPLYTSNYVYEEASVPFLSIVLKGVKPVYSEYINFEANKKEYFLKLVETGTYPSFYVTKESSSDLIYTNSSDIYSSEYSVYRDTIAQYAAELSQLNKSLEGAIITDHQIVGDVVVVTYSNGKKIYVNYGTSENTVDGITIAAMSYSAS